jgi:hypothetical protein
MPTYADGTMIQSPPMPEVDLVQKGLRRWIPDPETMACMGLNWSAVQKISVPDWVATPSGLPLPSRKDGSVLIGSGPKVYVVKGCQRHWIPDPLTLVQFGGWTVVKTVHDEDLNAIPEGAAIQSAQGTISFDTNWAGVQLLLGHDVVQEILSIGKDEQGIYGALMAVATKAGIMAGPVGIAIGLVAAYIAVELILIGALDHGNGVAITLPWPAIFFGQVWILIPSSR